MWATKIRHKQCAFNLYAAAMFAHSLPSLARAFGEADRAERFERIGKDLVKATQAKFWSSDLGLFVNNLPRREEEQEVRLCDRSLATAVLFDQCPGGKSEPALKVLAEAPPHMGLSYPANAGWRLWALGKGGAVETSS